MHHGRHCVNAMTDPLTLAIHFDGLIRQVVVWDYADLARLGGVSRARITQIMNLLNLPPWKQEELLILQGDSWRTRVTERKMRMATAGIDMVEFFSCRSTHDTA